jgi:hypothetical protein
MLLFRLTATDFDLTKSADDQWSPLQKTIKFSEELQ